MDVLWPIEPKDAPRLPGYRLGIFQLGNNVEFHLEVYRAAFLAQASLIVLHDLALDDFVRGLRTLGDPLGFMATREAGRAPDEPHARPTSFATSRCASRGARTSPAARGASSCIRRSASATWRRPAAAPRSSSCRTRSWSRRPDMRRADDRGRELRAAARGEGHALVGRGAGRPERGQATGRGARRRARFSTRAFTSRWSAGVSRATTSTAVDRREPGWRSRDVASPTSPTTISAGGSPPPTSSSTSASRIEGR